MNPERKASIEGIAALATGWTEMGDDTEEAVETALRANMAALGIYTRDDALLIAEAIRQLPQPADLSAEERERRRPIEDMVGVSPAETQLEAQLRARDMLLRIADTL